MIRTLALTALALFQVCMAQAQSLPRLPEAGLQAIDDGDAASLTAVRSASDPVTSDLLLWLYLRDDETESEASFDTYAGLIDRRPDWPNQTSLRMGAERAMGDSLSPGDVITFFGDAAPESGEGAVALARALLSADRAEDAATMIGAFWPSEGLSDEEHQLVVSAVPDLLLQHHAARADAMLWRWRTSDAENELPFLEEGLQALVRARIALINRSGDITARLALVPDRLRADPGLAYDRFNLLADRGDWTDAMTILQQRSTSADALGVPWRWGSWRRILARWQMREGNPEIAYALAARHFIAMDEANYADLEWLAGYIALTYLNDPVTALGHFTLFDAAVETPISKGRAGYWLGRAHDALGDADEAVASYLAAAEHQTSFYGLLAAEKLGLTLNPDLVGGEDFGDPVGGTLFQNELVIAGLMLLEADERGAAVSFLNAAAPSLDRRELGQLGAYLLEIDEPFYTVLVAKSAIRDGVWVQDSYFPIHPMAEMELPVEPAIALAIARQESEFRVDAGSAVGALGIMQLMPATAQEVAGWEDVPYSRSRLTSDWEYNAQLGARYLAFLQEEFGPSPVMIAAGYNAGPSRPMAWMDERGDPRVGDVDIIDWIEHIPFRETRNYVMRVTEGIPVYRARLTGRIGPVSFTDLLIGAKPVIRPQLRPNNLAGPTETSLRPVARP
ncbi:MAG: lytic transglycosylase domain-containing protein [Pseudomonadota bacterium]